MSVCNLVSKFCSFVFGVFKSGELFLILKCLIPRGSVMVVMEEYEGLTVASLSSSLVWGG